MARWLGLIMCFATVALVAITPKRAPSQFAQVELDAKRKFKGPKDKGPKKDAFPGEVTAQTWPQYVQWEFGKKDRNGDGYLSIDEMEGKMRDNLAYWDTNKDNLIDIREFEPFLKWKYEEKAAKEAQKQAQMEPKVALQQRIEEDLDRRAIVFRAGKLPRELPDWFFALDFDKDGQIALYEWRKGGNALADFAIIDRNDDGFLVAEEVLRHEALRLAQSKADAPTVAMLDTGSDSRGGKGQGWDKKGQGWADKGKKEKKDKKIKQ